MGAYFGNISRRQLLLFKFLHRRSICARPINFKSRPADETFPVKRGLSQLALAKGVVRACSFYSDVSLHFDEYILDGATTATLYR